MTGLPLEQRASRRQYLSRFNEAITYAMEVIYEQSYRPGVAVHADDLLAVGTVTSLKQVARVEAIGWRVAGEGVGPATSLQQVTVHDPLTRVGNSLVTMAELYRSRVPITNEDLDTAAEFVNGLRDLLVKGNRT